MQLLGVEKVEDLGPQHVSLSSLSFNQKRALILE